MTTTHNNPAGTTGGVVPLRAVGITDRLSEAHAALEATTEGTADHDLAVKELALAATQASRRTPRNRALKVLANVNRRRAEAIDRRRPITVINPIKTQPGDNQ